MSRQTERITRMEGYLDVSREAADALCEALEKYMAVTKKIVKLDRYYTGGEWRKDFEAWERGDLPQDLKCGVLSEDAVYDLLTDRRELVLKMADAVKEYLNEH